MAVNLFTGVTDNLWATASNWSQGTVPTASDTHITTFDGSSPNCTGPASALCNHINFTSYINTIDLTAGNLIVSGNVTLGSGMTVTGLGLLQVNASGTVTSNGKIWPNALQFSGASTITLADAIYILGNLTIGASSSNMTINGFKISTPGNLTSNMTTGNILGTTLIELTTQGSATMSFSSATSGTWSLNITVDNSYTNGTINFVNRIPKFNGILNLVRGRSGTKLQANAIKKYSSAI